MIYILLVGVTLIQALLYKSKYSRNGELIVKTKVLKLKRRKIQIISIDQCVFFLLLIMPVFLVAGLRYGISTDYIPVYDRGYSRVLDGDLRDHFEPAFYILIKICGCFTSNSWLMFLVTAIITFLLFFISFHQSRIFMMSITLIFAQGIYFDTFNGIRQYIVAAALLCCIPFIERGEFKKYIIIMGLCTLIHTSALITIPLYFLRKVKINYVIYTIAMIAMIVFRNQLFQIFLYILSLNMKYYQNFIIKGTLGSYISPSISQFATSFIALIPMIIVYRKIDKDRGGRLYLNLVLLNLAFAVCSLFLPLMERVMYYTKVTFLLGIPYACSLIENRKYRWIIVAVEIILLGSMNIYGMLNNDWYAVLPYKSIFE